MEDVKFDKIFAGGQLVLATIMLVLMTFEYVYHLFAGHMNLITFLAFSAMWVVVYKLFCWSRRDYKAIRSTTSKK